MQNITELHNDDSKIEQFVTKALGLNSHLLHQKELLCQKISQWNSQCEISDNITNQVVELQLEYDSIFKKASNFLNWQKSEDGKRAYMPKIDESHEEILFTKWDSRIREAKQEMEDAAAAAAAANSVIESVNENLHNANLVA